jgi:hypothetical protein
MTCNNAAQEGSSGSSMLSGWQPVLSPVQPVPSQLVDVVDAVPRRFSIAWTRIIPGGVAGSAVNMAGVNWYRTFIKALLEAGIRPAVTMYHWVSGVELPAVHSCSCSRKTE